MREVDLAAHVVAWLTADGWDVYQEVPFARGVVDIVAIRRPIVWAIETKTSLSLDLLAQVERRRGYAHMVSAAYPVARRASDARYFAERLARRNGFGLIHVTAIDGCVHEETKPRLDRRLVAKHLGTLVCDEHRTAAPAGTANGGHWTPFRAFSRDVLSRVRVEPGIAVRDLLDDMQHHYASNASARACLLRYAEDGTIPGLEVRRDGRHITLHPSSPSTHSRGPR